MKLDSEYYYMMHQAALYPNVDDSSKRAEIIEPFLNILNDGKLTRRPNDIQRLKSGMKGFKHGNFSRSKNRKHSSKNNS